MSFEKNKTLKLFRVKSAEVTKIQVEEIRKTTEDFAQRNAIRSGMFIKAHTVLYDKHIKEKLQILVEAIFEQIDEKALISKKDEENIINLIKEFVDGECKHKQNNLKSVIASSGLNQSGITSIQVATIASHFNEEKNLKIDYIRHLIEKHNIRSKELIKGRSFWQTKNGTITAVGTSVLALTSIIAILNSFGLFSTNDKYLGKYPFINKYSLSKKEITLGNTLQIFWNVSNADSVIIDPGIGKVSFFGEKIIRPNKTTTFKLSVYFEDKVLSMTKKVVVRDSLNNAL